MNRQVWLIGGTSDSATIANLLIQAKMPMVITVTTVTAKTLYSSQAQIEVGCLNLAAMDAFCEQHRIAVVIDASHPYATEVSRQAIAVTTARGIPYLRYERSQYQPSSTSQEEHVLELASFEQLLAGEYLTAQRVLLTVGCQALAQFQSWQHQATLFARVLPKISSLEMALAAGFTSDRLIAIRPPISLATEMALWQQWQISLVVTKASGKAGGEMIKRQVADALGIPLIIITRPPITYPQQTSAIADILIFCQQALL